MISRFCTILAVLATLGSLAPTVLPAASPTDRSGSGWPNEDSSNAEPAYRSAPRQSSPRGSDARYRRATLASTRSASNMQAEEVDSPPAWTGQPAQSGYLPDSLMDPRGQFGDFECGDGHCNTRWTDIWNGCGCRGPFYARGEYLAWWLKGDSVPALVTTSTAGTPLAQAGVLGQPGTSVIFGDQRLNNTGRSGGRVVLGWWIDPTTRIEGDFFILGQANTLFDQTSTGTPILARPFFNLGLTPVAAQGSNVIAFPGQFQGSVHVAETSSFLGAGLHATQNMICADFCEDRHYRVDFLYGYRYLRLKEGLTASDSITSLGIVGAAPAGTNFTSTDSFTTSNNFNGADLGLMTESRCERWCLTTIGRFGIGGTLERVTIGGSSTATPTGGATTTTTGGLLALPTNIGSFSHSGFTVVPELELKLGYDWTPNLRFTVGYDLIYWSRVVRPGGQIDTSVNTTQVLPPAQQTGAPGPLFAFRESDLWIQGVSVGGELRF